MAKYKLDTTIKLGSFEHGGWPPKVPEITLQKDGCSFCHSSEGFAVCFDPPVNFSICRACANGLANSIAVAEDRLAKIRKF